MTFSRFIPVFAVLLFLLPTRAQAQSPCEWFDWDGDGFVGANTWVYVLGQYDTAGEMDVDSSGWVDVRDLLAFIPFAGASCPVEWYDTSTGHIEGLVLTEFAVHETELAGMSDNIPAGSITYRLYAEMSHDEDVILAVYGDDEDPLTISSDGTFYGFGGDFGTVVVDDYNAVFSAIFPAYPFTTLLSCGRLPGEDPDGLLTSHVSHWQALLEDLDVNGDMVLSDATGGAWFNSGLQIPSQQDGLVFIGQFTVVDGSTLEGTLNLLAKTELEEGQGIEFAEGLTFSSDELDVLGCMDAAATNYNPAATIAFGVCFLPGDFNEDGAYTVADLLTLLDLFGCDNCPSGDLNNDGIVSVQDILIWLGFF
ncbi:MAG: hypothetical protein MUP94_05120 [Flavobacteriales bacterium]|nr:hypothetical protein [Flavobacteriales bacterium]